MEKYIIILLIIAAVFFIIYFYKKTRSITCMRCGRITNSFHSHTYNGALICDECFKLQTANNNTSNTNNTHSAENTSNTDSSFNTNSISNNSHTFYTKNISSSDDTFTININKNDIFTDGDFTKFNNEFNPFSKINPFNKDTNTEPFQSTYEIANFIAINENDKTWSLYPFNEVFKYSDLIDYSIKEGTTNISIPSFNMNKDTIDKLQANNIPFDFDKFFSNTGNTAPLNQIELTVVLKNSRQFTVSFASNNQNNDSSSNNDVEKITSLLEKIKNNA